MKTYEDVEVNLRPVSVGSELVGFVEVELEVYEPRPGWLDEPDDRGVEI